MTDNDRGGVSNQFFSGIMWAAAIVFGIMKVGGVEPFVDWSWWLVTAPIWLEFAIAIVIAGIAAVVYVVLGVITMTLNAFR